MRAFTFLHFLQLCGRREHLTKNIQCFTLTSNRSHQLNSRIVSTDFASQMTLNNQGMIVEITVVTFWNDAFAVIDDLLKLPCKFKISSRFFFFRFLVDSFSIQDRAYVVIVFKGCETTRRKPWAEGQSEIACRVKWRWHPARFVPRVWTEGQTVRSWIGSVRRTTAQSSTGSGETTESIEWESTRSSRKQRNAG